MNDDQVLLKAASQAQVALYDVSSMVRSATALFRDCVDYERSDELMAVLTVLDKATELALNEGHTLGAVL